MWETTKNIVQKDANSRGLGVTMIATSIIVQSEKYYPGMFKALSYRNGTLNIELEQSKTMEFKMIQGKLISDLNQYCTEHNFPLISRIRLTNPKDFPNI